MSGLRNLVEAIPIGTKVRMADCLEADNSAYQHDWVTASKPWKIGGHYVVMLEGFRGGFCLDKLELAEVE